MRIRYLLMALSLLIAAPAAAADEVYIISRDHSGSFLSSHQIFPNNQPQKQMARVDYCGHTYFVYWGTLDWLDSQAYEGHRLGVEYSNGKNWRLICRNPDQQVAGVRDQDKPDVRAEPKLPKDAKYGWIQLLNKRAVR